MVDPAQHNCLWFVNVLKALFAHIGSHLWRPFRMHQAACGMHPECSTVAQITNLNFIGPYAYNTSKDHAAVCCSPVSCGFCPTLLCGHSDKQKGEALGQLFERLNESLESTGSFPALNNEDTSPAKPQAQVWTMYQLAQHYDMQGRTGEPDVVPFQSANLVHCAVSI